MNWHTFTAILSHSPFPLRNGPAYNINGLPALNQLWKSLKLFLSFACTLVYNTNTPPWQISTFTRPIPSSHWWDKPPAWWFSSSNQTHRITDVLIAHFLPSRRHRSHSSHRCNSFFPPIPRPHVRLHKTPLLRTIYLLNRTTFSFIFLDRTISWTTIGTLGI